MTTKEQYRQFCEQEGCPIPVFIQHWWMDAVCEKWEVALAFKETQIVGVWTYALESKLGVTLLRNPLLTPYSGPYVIFPASLKDTKKDLFEQQVLTDLLQQLPPAKVWHLNLPTAQQQVGIFQRAKITASVKQTFILSLKEDWETLKSRFSTSIKRNLQKGQIGLTIQNEPEQIALLYQYLTHTLSLKNKTSFFTLKQLNHLLNACIEKNAGALWVARNAQNEIEALVFNVWDTQTSYYLMGAKNEHSADYTALTNLLVHSIQTAQKKQLQYFDFEGSTDAGVERFFAGFKGVRTLCLVLKKNASTLWKIKEMLGKN